MKTVRLFSVLLICLYQPRDNIGCAKPCVNYKRHPLWSTEGEKKKGIFLGRKDIRKLAWWGGYLCVSLQPFLQPMQSHPQPLGWLAEHGWIKVPLSSGATMQWNQLDRTWWCSLSSPNGRHPHLGPFAVLWSTIIHCRVAQYLPPIQGWQEVWVLPFDQHLPSNRFLKHYELHTITLLKSHALEFLKNCELGG